MTQNELPREQPPVDRLDLATDKLRATPISPGPSLELLASTLAALQAETESQTLTDIVRLQKRTKLMFRIARYSGATSALILLATVLIWLLSDRGTSMAFADVMQKIKQANSVSLQQRQKLGDQPEITVDFQMQSDVVRMQILDAQVVIYDRVKKQGVEVTPIGKRLDLYRFELNDDFLKRIPNLLQALRTSKEQTAERLGTETVDGKQQETFRLKELPPLMGTVKSDLKLWADPETGLPSKLEIRWKDKPDQPESYIVMEKMDWNAKFDPSLFDLEHPNVDCLKPALSRTVPIDRPVHVLPIGTKQVILSGHVLAPDGKPVVGAEVFISGTEIRSDWTFPTVLVISTDSQGFFEGAVDLPSPEAIERVILTATHAGMGVVGTSLKSAPKLDDITLKLVAPGNPIQGRILNSAGQPVAKAHVHIEGLTQGSIGGQNVLLSSEALRDVWTNNDGRFSLHNLGADRIARLEIGGPGIERVQLQVSTKVLEQPGKILNPEFEHKSGPARTVKGRVVDAKTKEPLNGIQITISKATGRVFTDRQGEFEFAGAPQLEKYGIMAVPALEMAQPYFIGSASVATTPGTDPVIVEIGLHRGIKFTGRVVDAETGRPISAQVAYFPLYPNANLKAEMGYGAAGGGGALSEATTLRANPFSFSVLPGPGAVCIRALEENRYERVHVKPEEFFKPDEYGADRKQLIRANRLLRQEHEQKSVSVVVQDQYHAIILLNPQAGQPAIEQEIRLTPRHE